MLRSIKILSIVLALNLIAGGTYAFAAQNTASENTAVFKTSMLLGYDVTGIIFDVNENDPTLVDAITFRIAPSHGSAKANSVKVQTKVDGPWAECSLMDDVLPARVATCTFESLAADDVTALNIVAR